MEPTRTATNIRLYDNDQLIKLLNAVTLIDHGWKISHIASLETSDLERETEKLLSNESEGTYSAHIHSLITHMLVYNESSFIQVLGSAIRRLGIKRAILEVIYPFLVKVGMMWRINEMNPSQEHFASHIVKQKLYAAIDQLAIPTESKVSFLLFLPEGENHEIALLLANFILREQGMKVIYLGQDVPFSSVEMAYNECQPNYLFTSVLAVSANDQIGGYLRLLSSSFPNSQLLITGNVSDVVEKLALNNVQFLGAVSQLEKVIKDVQALKLP